MLAATSAAATSNRGSMSAGLVRRALFRASALEAKSSRLTCKGSERGAEEESRIYQAGNGGLITGRLWSNDVRDNKEGGTRNQNGRTRIPMNQKGMPTMENGRLCKWTAVMLCFTNNRNKGVGLGTGFSS